MKRDNKGRFVGGHGGITGSKNKSWLGDKVGYFGVHIWLNKYYGKADHCENNPNHKTKNYEWANITGIYKRDRRHYKQLCISCHRFFDKGMFCKNGHKFTNKNTWIRKNGWRVCRICAKQRIINYKNKSQP